MDFSKQQNWNKRLIRGNYNEKLYSKILIWVARVICIAALGSVCVGIGVVMGTFFGMLDGVPDVSLNSLQINRQTSSIYDLEGNKITDIQTAEQRTSIAFEDMPQNLIDAVVAIEDKRFFNHSGIDLEGIIRAGVINLRSGGTSQGGSTITQQMIKKLVLTSDQNWKRKIQEWYLALRLEDEMTALYGKERTKELILESYLNYNFLGNSCYGVEAAANRYFGKHAKELSLSECALIAGLFNAPSSYDPIVNYKNLSRQRQVLVLENMLEQGYITEEEYRAAFLDNVFARVSNHNAEYEADDTVYSYFVDSVIYKVMNDLQEKLGYSESDAYNTLYYGGLKIYITQDARIQGIIDEIYADPSSFQQDVYYEMHYDLTLFDEKDPNITDNYGTYGLFSSQSDAQAAANEFKADYVSDDMVRGIDYVENYYLTEQPQYPLTIIDYHTGHIVGLAGGRGEKTQNLTLNRAIDSLRQPGSTFKVIASFSAAVDAGGFSCNSSMDDAPLSWYGWQPRNWWGNYYYGFQTLRQAFEQSENIVTARFMRAVGVETNFEYAQRFGFTTLRTEPDEWGNTDIVPSLCLGSASVKNYELTAAYGAIANDGVYIEPILYTRIENADGSLFYENEQETHRVMRETSAFMVRDMLRTTITNGTGWQCNFDRNWAIAGKTGTTNDENDYAFVGFTPLYVCGIQVGFDYTSYPQVYYDSLGKYSIDPNGAELLAYAAHKELWNKVMIRVHEAYEPIGTFGEPPEGITMVTLCRDSGKLPGQYCSKDPRGNRLVTDYCAVEDYPTQICDRHVQVTVCEESHRTATEFCPEDKAKEGVYITRTAAEIAEIGEYNLERIQDFEYAYYESLGECEIHTAEWKAEEDRKKQEEEAQQQQQQQQSSESSTPGGGESSSSP